MAVLDATETSLRWTGQNVSIGHEARPMTRAVPCEFWIVPDDKAPLMTALGRSKSGGPGLVAESGDLLPL